MILPAPHLAIFDLGGTELVLIMTAVLIFFGGEKLPGFARGLGKAIREFKKATSGIEEEFKRAMEEPPPRPAARPNRADSPTKIYPPETATEGTAVVENPANPDLPASPPAKPPAFEHGEN